MQFIDYIQAVEKTYAYKLKTINVLDDHAMDRIETLVMKYSPVNISRPRKLMMQSSPLDFYTIVDAAEIYVIDLEFNVPASPYVLHRELCQALGINGDHMVIRGANDPVEIENCMQAAKDSMDDEAEDKGMVQASVLLDPDYKDGDGGTNDLYGDEYNAKFLDYLRKIQDEKPVAKKVNPPHPLSVWGEQPVPEMDNGDFNKDIEGAPTIGKAGDGPNANVSNVGNMEDDKRTYKRQYGKNGTLTMLKREVNTLK